MNVQLAVIGAGPGGYAAAFMAADLGMQVALIEENSRLGGVCLLRGCIPSKALLHVAKTIDEANAQNDWGVIFAPPKIELDTLRDRKEKAIGNLSAGLKQLCMKRKVQLIRARAVFEDSRTLKLLAVGSDGPSEERLSFDHCIIATGSRPNKIPALDLPTDRVMDSTSALALPDVPESLLIVGGGYIGLEMGSVYAALGSKVTVVELTDGLLPGVDRDLVRPLEKKIQAKFAAVYLNTKVLSLKDRKDAIEVELQGNVPEKIQRFSRVLISVGRTPNTKELGLDRTKVGLTPHGFIEVDHRRRTADERISAIGDAAGEPMLAHKAAHEGKTAVESLAGKNAAFAPRAIPAVVFTDPEIAWAGLTETQAKAQAREITVAVFPWAASGRAQSIGRPEGLTKWIIDPGSERLLGCGIVGYGAGDLIGEAVLAIEMGATVRDVADSIHPHPTFCETLGAAADVFFGMATDIYRPKK